MTLPKAVDPALVSSWVGSHVKVELAAKDGYAAFLTAKAILPLSAPAAFELLTHPDNASIFRCARGAAGPGFGRQQGSCGPVVTRWRQGGRLGAGLVFGCCPHPS